MIVVYYDVKKSDHVAINNVYSIIDNENDNFVTVHYKTIDGSKNMRKEVYEELIELGYSPEEAWEKISEMEFAEDYE